MILSGRSGLFVLIRTMDLFRVCVITRLSSIKTQMNLQNCIPSHFLPEKLVKTQDWKNPLLSLISEF